MFNDRLAVFLGTLLRDSLRIGAFCQLHCIVYNRLVNIHSQDLKLYGHVYVLLKKKHHCLCFSPFLIISPIHNCCRRMVNLLYRMICKQNTYWAPTIILRVAYPYIIQNRSRQLSRNFFLFKIYGKQLSCFCSCIAYNSLL